MTEERPLTRRELRERERALAAAAAPPQIVEEPAVEAPDVAGPAAPPPPPPAAAAAPAPAPASAPSRTSIADRLGEGQGSRPLSRRELRARTIAAGTDEAPVSATADREALRRPVQEPTTTTGLSVVDPTGSVTAVNVPVVVEREHPVEAAPVAVAEPAAAPELAPAVGAVSPPEPAPAVVPDGPPLEEGPATEALAAVEPEPVPAAFDDLFAGLEEDVAGAASPERKSVFGPVRSAVGEPVDAANAVAPGTEPARKARGWGALPYLVQLLIVILSMFIVGVVIWLVLDGAMNGPASALGLNTIEGFL